MIKNILQEIGGIGIYGIVSLCLFFAVFSSALVWTCVRGGAFCKRMGELPLEKEKGEL